MLKQALASKELYEMPMSEVLESKDLNTTTLNDLQAWNANEGSSRVKRS
jgi:hypothetical protein